MHGSAGCFLQTKLYKMNVTNVNARSIKVILREATILTAQEIIGNCCTAVFSSAVLTLLRKKRRTKTVVKAPTTLHGFEIGLQLLCTCCPD